MYYHIVLMQLSVFRTRLKTFLMTQATTPVTVDMAHLLRLSNLRHINDINNNNNNNMRSPSTALTPPSKRRCGLTCLVFNILYPREFSTEGLKNNINKNNNKFFISREIYECDGITWQWFGSGHQM